MEQLADIDSASTITRLLCTTDPVGGDEEVTGSFKIET